MKEKVKKHLPNTKKYCKIGHRLGRILAYFLNKVINRVINRLSMSHNTAYVSPSSYQQAFSLVNLPYSLGPLPAHSYFCVNQVGGKNKLSTGLSTGQYDSIKLSTSYQQVINRLSTNKLHESGQIDILLGQLPALLGQYMILRFTLLLSKIENQTIFSKGKSLIAGHR